MVVPSAHTATSMHFDGAPSYPPTPTPVVDQGASGGEGVPRGVACLTLRPQLVVQISGMHNPYGVPLQPLSMPGVASADPQLMGSLPFSPPTGTSQFRALYDAGVLNPDPSTVVPAAESATPAEMDRARTWAYPARVVEALDCTQLGGPRTALPPPVVANSAQELAGPHRAGGVAPRFGASCHTCFLAALAGHCA